MMPIFLLGIDGLLERSISFRRAAPFFSDNCIWFHDVGLAHVPCEAEVRLELHLSGGHTQDTGNGGKARRHACFFSEETKIKMNASTPQ